MDKNTDIGFLTLICKQDEVKQIIEHHAIHGGLTLFVKKGKNKQYHQLTDEDLYNVRRKHPHKAKIMILPPGSIKLGGIRCEEGEFLKIGIDDILVDLSIASEFLALQQQNENNYDKDNNPSTNERYNRWRIAAKEIKNKHPRLTKEEIAKKVFDKLKQENPSYVTKKDGSYYEPTYIARQFTL
ncbi:hypothetical protein [Candidatus Berkiella aquae]|uniref:Uncharacterized protein n=1 Tax=Candidatus Berkiella aquae TaxID=295108 RepID=A0A0Q9YM92_9GAMM|nr:hypothetical protein [Candidatus Berkiella aquae]MCS5710441.1 hypothetical protein [Candidatus Berkiella aquae]